MARCVSSGQVRTRRILQKNSTEDDEVTPFPPKQSVVDVVMPRCSNSS